MNMHNFLTVCVISYLIGSIPTAYIVGRLHNINIFEVGSGNMGANNTARALGIQWGILVWLLDCIKGVTALWIARKSGIIEPATAMVISAVCVVLGHNWSLFATIITGKVRGGKGAATASGTWVLLVPPLIIAIVLMVWALVVYLTRYMSLAVLTAAAVVSIIFIGMVITNEREPIYVAYLLVTFMIFYRHKANIRALLKGNERRFGERVKS